MSANKPIQRSEIESLKEYAETPRQLEVLGALEQHAGLVGTSRKAAKSLGITLRCLERTLQRIRANAAKKGWAPNHGLDRPAPEGYKYKGFSTLGRNADGEPTWYKVEEDRERQLEMLHAAVAALSEEIPRAEPVPPPETPGEEDLLNLYVLTDYHLGMLAWHEETGADWDVKTAETLLLRFFATAIDRSPPAQTAYLCQLGDFLHFDSLRAETPTSRHLLDADTRFPRLVRVAIRVIRKIIRMLLEKYDTVVVLMADANHDPASEAWLREMIAAFYDEEPRVVVDQNADSYYCYEHGLTSLFFHHGHRRGIKDIDNVFAAKFREVFGRTKYSYGHIGHFHHFKAYESNIMIVEQHPTLAAPDAYSAHAGHVSGRTAKVITYSKRGGEVFSLKINSEMLS